jgi:hypothetical protein
MAARGITTGGNAMADSSTCCAFPAVVPTLVVDDVSAESTDPRAHVRQSFGGFITQVALELIADARELSGTKSLCCTSSAMLSGELRKMREV